MIQITYFVGIFIIRGYKRVDIRDHRPEGLGLGRYLSSHLQAVNHLFLSNIASVTKLIRSVEL